MKSASFVRYTLSAGVAAALLTACDGSQPRIGAPETMSQNASRVSLANVQPHMPRSVPTPNGVVEFAYVPNDYSGNVYAYRINLKNGTLTQVYGSPFEAGSAPEGVAVDPTGKFAYVTDTDYYTGSGSLSAYRINATTGALTPVKGSPFTSGSSPIGVAVDPTGEYVYVGNDGSNNVSAYKIDARSGALTQVKGSPFAAGSRPFDVAVDPVGPFLYVANCAYGADNVSAYRINPKTGALKQVEGSPFSAGPRAFGVAVDPNGKFAYVTNYGPSDGSVSAYAINPISGALEQVKGSPFAAGSATSAVAIDAAGKFLYAANSDSWNISAYTINATSGALKSVNGSPFASGQAPEGIAVDPTGKIVVVSNGLFESSSYPGYVSAFAIDAKSGALTQVPGSPFGAGVGPHDVATCRVKAGKCIPPPL